MSGTATLAMGGNGGGGAGGVAGAVEVRNKADVTTQGHNSTGVFAQSLGGGGGDGGLSVAGTLLGTDFNTFSANLAMGGGAGNGGKGSDVSVVNDGEITAFGVSSMGITAQSVGKGGGMGGLSIAGQLANPGSQTYTMNFAAGGNRGGGRGA